MNVEHLSNPSQAGLKYLDSTSRGPIPPIMAAHEVGEIERDPGDDAMLDLLELEADGAGYHGGIVQLADKPQCACRWFRAWQLPCSHIWLHHFCFDSPQPIHFLQSFDLWSNSGFEI